MGESTWVPERKFSAETPKISRAKNSSNTVFESDRNFHDSQSGTLSSSNLKSYPILREFSSGGALASFSTKRVCLMRSVFCLKSKNFIDVSKTQIMKRRTLTRKRIN